MHESSEIKENTGKLIPSSACHITTAQVMRDIQYSAAAASWHKTENFLCLRARASEVLQEEVVQHKKALYSKGKQLYLLWIS